VILLGTLDAFAGFIAVVAFTIGIAVSGGITDASSIRTLMGLAIVGFGPALIAGASRPMRRSDSDYTAWERIGDFVVIPLVGAFAVQGTIKALPALSGFQMPIAEQANLLALIALIGLLLRVGLETRCSQTLRSGSARSRPGHPTPWIDPATGPDRCGEPACSASRQSPSSATSGNCGLALPCLPRPKRACCSLRGCRTHPRSSMPFRSASRGSCSS
jgi:hypothetical protein